MWGWRPRLENCEVCHKRHGFTQTLSLQKPLPQLCTDCHKELGGTAAGAAPAQGSSHLAVKDVSCVACHDPHASNKKGLLRAGEAQTCAQCHERIELALQSKSKHKPFAEGRCADCHAPHTSAQSGLLVAPEKELCARCHGSLEELPELHRRPEVAGAPCSSCHDPHSNAAPAKGGRSSMLPT